MSVTTACNFFAQTLEKLDIMGNQIGDEGIRELANALENNKVNRIVYSHLSSSSAISHTDTQET
jgi:Ran GTPase-activating protein (RanGAP) involved in mRNA processing and transport